MLICNFCEIFKSNDKPNFSKHVKNCFANPESLNKMKTKWDCLMCDSFFVKKSAKRCGKCYKDFTNLQK